jgi:D-alanine-D-alanine ligase
MTLPAVLFGGPSPEHDISITTGLMAARTLRDVHAIYWDKTGRFHLVDAGLEASDFADGTPRKSKPLQFVAEPGAGFLLKKKAVDLSVIVLATHGGPGEDGTLQGMLDLVGYRYSGPGQAGSALGMDKLAFGAAVERIGLPTLPRQLLTPTAPAFAGPFILKPRFGGSSIGIEVVEDHATALAFASASPHHADGSVVEPFLEGVRDLQVAIRFFPELQTSMIEEPVQAVGGVYSYQQKYLAWDESSGVSNPQAELSEPVDREVRRMARVVAEMIGIRGIARVDFLLMDENLTVNEINTIPGSLSGALWAPLTREELLADVVAELEASSPRRYSTHGADGTALRNARSIASKLG